MICLLDTAHRTFTLGKFKAASMVMKELIAAHFATIMYGCSRPRKSKKLIHQKKRM